MALNIDLAKLEIHSSDPYLRKGDAGLHTTESLDASRVKPW